MSGAGLEIVVDGQWLSLVCRYGDVEMSTEWPGGSAELSWSLGTQSAQRFRGGRPVAAYYGPVCVWSGTLIEPDQSQDQMVAQGLWRSGERFPALDGSLNATAVPNTAASQAIARGLGWTLIGLDASATDIDVSQGPVTVGALLDTWAENNGVRWGVKPSGEVYAVADPTTPAYQMWPLDDGLGYALDNYASTLFCRYLDSATSTYKTVAVTDSVAEGQHGDQEAVVDLTGRGAITTAKATAIGNHLLTLGRSTPQWTQSIEVSYGELLTPGGVPTALETVAAGTVVRIHGGAELAQRQNGQMYVDVLIGQTNLAGGLLTLTPLQIASRNFTDILTDLSKKKGA